MIGTTFIDLTLFLYFPEAVKSAKLKCHDLTLDSLFFYIFWLG